MPIFYVLTLYTASVMPDPTSQIAQGVCDYLCLLRALQTWVAGTHLSIIDWTGLLLNFVVRSTLIITLFLVSASGGSLTKYVFGLRMDGPNVYNAIPIILVITNPISTGLGMYMLAEVKEAMSQIGQPLSTIVTEGTIEKVISEVESIDPQCGIIQQLAGVTGEFIII